MKQIKKQYYIKPVRTYKIQRKSHPLPKSRSQLLTLSYLIKPPTAFNFQRTTGLKPLFHRSAPWTSQKKTSLSLRMRRAPASNKEFSRILNPAFGVMGGPSMTLIFPDLVGTASLLAQADLTKKVVNQNLHSTENGKRFQASGSASSRPISQGLHCSACMRTARRSVKTPLSIEITVPGKKEPP